MNDVHARHSSRLKTAFATACVVFALGAATPLTAQQSLGEPEIAVWPVRGGIYMLVGGGGNTTVQVGEDGVFVVDTKLAQIGEPLLAKIRELSDGPIRYIVNTHAHADHVGGNAVIAPAGSTIAGGNVARTIANADVGASVIAHENVLVRMSGAENPPPFEAWPTDTFFVPQKDFYFNGEAVEILHKPAAHTDGDVIVFFRGTDVIATGDVYNTTSYPVMLPGDGGSINGILEALNDLIRMTVPAEKQEGGTLVIPGHGRLSDEADVVEYRDMLTIIRDRVEHLIDTGMSLNEVKQARPTRDYDGRYGAETGFWTTEQFVEAVYRSLVEDGGD